MGPDDGGPTLRRWLCRLINQAANVNVNPATLDDWLKAWPCVLIFDGLDEVTQIRARQRVLSEITALVEKADANDADLFIIVTTRPTGYTEQLLPERFGQVDLDDLLPKEAEAYAHLVTQQRYHDDPERGDAVLVAFKSALANPGAERLLKTPLQVLILTVIVAGSGGLPANRYLLFWTYYETVFRREAAKPTTYRDFFTNHRPDITELHQKVGFLLQIQCEATFETRGRMPRSELRELAKERLLAVGHGIAAANELADRMIEVATKRLVLLGPDEGDTVSFDVRSLQELMAGCALVDGGDDLIRHNLTTTAASPHWRNTWLFAAGRLYTGGDHHRALVLDIIARSDKGGHWPGWLYQTAPELAADVLDDGLAATRPNDQRRLIELALRSLDGPVPEEPKAIARGLSAAANSPEHKFIIRDTLREAVKQRCSPVGGRSSSVFRQVRVDNPRAAREHESLRRHVAIQASDRSQGQSRPAAARGSSSRRRRRGLSRSRHRRRGFHRMRPARAAAHGLRRPVVSDFGQSFQLRGTARRIERPRGQSRARNRLGHTAARELGRPLDVGAGLLAGRGPVANRVTATLNHAPLHALKPRRVPWEDTLSPSHTGRPAETDPSALKCARRAFSAASLVEFLELFAQLLGFGLQLFQPCVQRLA